MKFYFAPMEGITGYIYRNAFHQHFGEVDKYFMPFIATNQYGSFSAKEKQDTLPSNNKGLHVIPQILSNNAEDFIKTANVLAQLGYDEVNLNLGCPSGTVVAKGKGSGFLAETEKLERFLDVIFEQTPLAISIKTRIGKYSDDEFDTLLPLFNRYPMTELIIHPRVQKDYYKNTPRIEVFQRAMQESTQTLCYNGDLFTLQSYDAFIKNNSGVDAIMFGRGLLANPGLIHTIRTGEPVNAMQVKAFLEQLCDDYTTVLSGDRNVLFKLKELWYYMGYLFEDADKPLKKIKKSQKIIDYKLAVDQLFQEKSIREQPGFSRF